MGTTILKIYVLAASAAAFALMGADKLRAVRGRWRIPEKVLFLSAILGGSPGAILGMLAFRHKTRKLIFVIGMPAILLVQLLILKFVMQRWGASL